MGKDMIEGHSLSHTYPSEPKRPVLRDFSISIQAGECIALTGPSGSGKSTLARIIAGFIRPTSGTVKVDGVDRTGQPSRDIFVIHQETDLFPWQRAKRQIQFAAREGTPDRSEQLLKLVKLESFGHFFPSQLSGGMKKRLAIARALAGQPKLLILDEALGHLDPPLRQELIADLKNIWETTGVALIFITHDVDHFQAFAPREVRLTSLQTPRQ